MSKRSSIVKALAEKLKLIDGDTPYSVNLYNNSFPYLKFWDEVQNFPSVYCVAGNETREYMPSSFKWGFLSVSLKVYCKGDSSQDELERLLEDIETLLDNNNSMPYNDTGGEITDILITSISTDEGLLAPYAIGEINLQIRYEIL